MYKQVYDPVAGSLGWSAGSSGFSTSWRALVTAAIIRSEPMAMMRRTFANGSGGGPSVPGA